MTLSITTLCHYAEYHCAECRDLFIVMLNVIMLSVVMLRVIMLNVIMLSVVAPSKQTLKNKPGLKHL
jgi:hypothetical protein